MYDPVCCEKRLNIQGLVGTNLAGRGRRWSDNQTTVVGHVFLVHQEIAGRFGVVSKTTSMIKRWEIRQNPLAFRFGLYLYIMDNFGYIYTSWTIWAISIHHRLFDFLTL